MTYTDQIGSVRTHIIYIVKVKLFLKLFSPFDINETRSVTQCDNDINPTLLH